MVVLTFIRITGAKTPVLPMNKSKSACGFIVLPLLYAVNADRSLLSSKQATIIPTTAKNAIG